MRDTTPEPQVDHEYLESAVRWVQERGGTEAVARSMLRVSLSDNPARVRAAVEKAGAPPMVFALIYRTLFQIAQRTAVARDVDEGPEHWSQR